MGTFHRRHARAIGAAAVAIAALATVPNATAEPSNHPIWAPGGDVQGPAPDEALDEMRGCPTPEQFPELLDDDGNVIGRVPPELCLRVTAYDGEIKIGSTVAPIPGPLELTLGVGLVAGTGVIVPGNGGGGGLDAINIPGGLLGIPELDPLIEALGNLLSVTVTPRLGAAAVPADQALSFLLWLQGDNSAPVTLTLPLSIQLNNLLLGNQCTIPEFNLNLTTGTTATPEGVAPMAGSSGEFRLTRFMPVGGTFLAKNYAVSSRVGSRVVDNTFRVEGASKCDLLLGDMLDQPAGLFDDVVNSQAGLPGNAGSNYATFSVDTLLVPYRDFLVAATGTPSSPIAFGDIAVGTTSTTRTVTVENTGSMPFRPQAAVLGGGSAAAHYEIVDDRCVDQTLARHETCEVDVRFRPTATGSRNATLTITDSSAGVTVGFVSGRSSLQLTGRGVNP